MITKQIKLQNGVSLELEMEKEFLEYVRQHFALPNIQCINDEHLKHFILRATDNAITKAEQQIRATG